MQRPRFVDISMSISSRVVTDPEPLRPRIHYSGHKEELQHMLPFFPGLTEQDLPDGEAWAVEEVQLSTHSGSHMDAPWHYHSTTDHGRRRAPTIDEAPLDLFMRPGVKLDLRHFPDGSVVSRADLEAELARINYTLQALRYRFGEHRGGCSLWGSGIHRQGMRYRPRGDSVSVRARSSSSRHGRVVMGRAV
jgi:kynurenine formamidase